MLRSFKPGQKRRGQALAEMALILPLAIVVLALAVDFARVMVAYLEIGNMARAGAQFGTLVGYLPEWRNQPKGQIIQQIKVEALAEQATIYGVQPTVKARWLPHFSEGGMVEPTADPFYVPNDPSATHQCIAEVTVKYPFEPFIKIPPIPNTIEIQRRVVMRVQLVPAGYNCMY